MPALPAGGGAFSPAWNGTQPTVARALKLIARGALAGGSVEMLADRLGIGPRHLARLFAEHVGASPSQVARTRQIQIAKRLLDESDHPVGVIAAKAGFGSARRMRAAFAAVYGRSPSQIRARRTETHGSV